MKFYVWIISLHRSHSFKVPQLSWIILLINVFRTFEQHFRGTWRLFQYYWASKTKNINLKWQTNCQIDFFFFSHTFCKWSYFQPSHRYNNTLNTNNYSVSLNKVTLTNHNYLFPCSYFSWRKGRKKEMSYLFHTKWKMIFLKKTNRIPSHIGLFLFYCFYF